MKNFLFATAAAIALFAAPAFAGNVLGCETAPAQGSNFTVKVDPTCHFSGQNIGGGSFLALGVASIDTDNDPTTPDQKFASIKNTLTDPPTDMFILK